MAEICNDTRNHLEHTVSHRSSVSFVYNDLLLVDATAERLSFFWVV